MGVILPTTPAVDAACKELETAVGRFLDARRTLPVLGKYESELEALNLFYLALRDVEGVITLGRSDLVLLPPAVAAARAAFESGVKSAWLVDADDHYGREVRWLAHLAGEERLYKRLGQRLAELGENSGTANEREESINRFRTAVAQKLPDKFKELSRFPSFDQMLTSIGGQNLYAVYVHLSQFMHGEHAATWLYRSGGLGTEKRLGEFIQPAHWYLPLRVSWLSLVHPGRLLISRLGGDPEVFMNRWQETGGISAIERVKLAVSELH